jgi:hypothetical protein
MSLGHHQAHRNHQSEPEVSENHFRDGYLIVLCQADKIYVRSRPVSLDWQSCPSLMANDPAGFQSLKIPESTKAPCPPHTVSASTENIHGE